MTPNSEMPPLRIVRRFDVPPDKVFDALTEPDAMRVWWGDDTVFDLDLRVGGRWTITHRANGMESIATGQYLGVERPWRLNYTYSRPQISPNSDTITIQIAPDGDGCILTFVQTGEDIGNELRGIPLGGTSGSEARWQQGFDWLAAAWASQTTILLQQVRLGSAKAKDELIKSLYDRFRQRAHQRLRHERPGLSLTTEGLTDEALLRMLKNDEFEKAANGNQVFRAFARALRQVLIDHARRHNAGKRGGDKYDLQMMSLPEGPERLPVKGKGLVIVAVVKDVLHFRIFDNAGTKAVDTDERVLSAQAGPISELRKQLADKLPPHELSLDEKRQVINAVTSIVGHTHGDRQRVELDDLADHVSDTSRFEVLALHLALEALAGDYPRAAAVLEMRFFGGFGMAEIAEVLSGEAASVSLSTVERDTRFGLAWLRNHLSPESAS